MFYKCIKILIMRRINNFAYLNGNTIAQGPGSVTSGWQFVNYLYEVILFQHCFMKVEERSSVLPFSGSLFVCMYFSSILKICSLATLFRIAGSHGVSRGNFIVSK